MKRPLLWILGVWIMGEIAASWMGISFVPVTSLDRYLADRESAGVQVTGTIQEFRRTSSGYAYVLSDTYIVLSDTGNSSEAGPAASSGEAGRGTSCPVLVFSDDISDCKIGYGITVTGRLSLFGVPSNPGQFDTRAYYEAQGLHFSLREKQRQIRSTGVRRLPQYLWDLREALRESLLRVSEEEEAGIFLSLFLGDKSCMDPEVKDLYQIGGISHILAISGLHVSLFGMALHEVLRKLGCPHLPNLLISGGILAAYVEMTGASPSALRALVMFLVFLLAKAVGRSYDLLSALSLAGLLLLADSPLLLWQAAFQLSFLAMAGVGALWPLMQEKWERFWHEKGEKSIKVEDDKRICYKNDIKVGDIGGCRRGSSGETEKEERKRGQIRPEMERGCSKGGRITDGVESIIRYSAFIVFNVGDTYRKIVNNVSKVGGEAVPESGRKAGEAILFSLAIQLTTLPVLAWHYYEISVYSPVINLAVLPFAGLLLGTVALTAALGSLGSGLPAMLSGVTVIPARALRIWFDSLCRLSERLPGHSLILGRPESWQILLYYGLLIAGTVLWRREKIWGKQVLLWGLLLFLSIQHLPDRQLQITALDVGQGDCAVIRCPGGQCCLVDGGSSSVSDVGSRRILPFLEYSGVRRLEAVFVSHGDADHTNGLAAVLENRRIRVGALCVTEAAAEDPDLEDLLAAAGSRGIPVRVIRAEQTWQWGDVTFTCLYPSDRGLKAGDRNKNDTSMVLQVTEGEFTALFTGDLEEAGEKELLRGGMPGKADLLKTGHHGSRGSSCEEFLWETRPELALISVGAKNSYGHPHRETLERLEAAGARILRTDEGGALTVCVRGGIWEAETWR